MKGMTAAAAWIFAATGVVPLAAPAQHAGLTEDRPRPLHRRLAESDALALGAVEAVELGRIQVGAATSLRGDVPTRFELKRAPSSPPPLAAGDRVVLLLRGARSPYLLVDEPDELWKLGAPEADAAVAEALRALDAERADPAALASRYAAWLASGAALQRPAAQALEGDADLLARADARVPAMLADLALAAEDASLRDDAARAAVKSELGLVRLLAGLPGTAADPQVVAHALFAGLSRADGRAAARRCLEHASPAVRGATLRFGGMIAGDPAIRSALQRIASDDPDEQLRLAARRALSTR
jgi:hypothetical protein